MPGFPPLHSVLLISRPRHPGHECPALGDIAGIPFHIFIGGVGDYKDGGSMDGFEAVDGLALGLDSSRFVGS